MSMLSVTVLAASCMLVLASAGPGGSPWYHKPPPSDYFPGGFNPYGPHGYPGSPGRSGPSFPPSSVPGAFGTQPGDMMASILETLQTLTAAASNGVNQKQGSSVPDYSNYQGTATLGYWDIRGRGQPIRFMLEYTGNKYTEKRYVACPPAPAPPAINHRGYSSFTTAPRTTNCWFTDDKIDNPHGLDFNNLPYFIDGDIKLTQSLAVMKHIGEKNNLNGRCAKERAHVDMLINQIADWMAATMKLTYNTAEASMQGELFAKYNNVDLPPILDALSKYLGNKKWLIGDEITTADFLFFENVDMHMALTPDLMKKYPTLVAYHKRFLALPQIDKYRKSGRSVEPTRFNAGFAKYLNA